MTVKYNTVGDVPGLKAGDREQKEVTSRIIAWGATLGTAKQVTLGKLQAAATSASTLQPGAQTS